MVSPIEAPDRFWLLFLRLCVAARNRRTVAPPCRRRGICVYTLRFAAKVRVCVRCVSRGSSVRCTRFLRLAARLLSVSVLFRRVSRSFLPRRHQQPHQVLHQQAPLK